MHVELLTYTPEPEKVVAAAAKLCYASSDIDSLLNNLTEDKVKSFIDRLASIGHESPFEHISFTFGIEGISRACSHQLVRHRIASYSQQSQRYVKMDNFEYVTPPSISADESLNKAYSDIMHNLANQYEALQSVLADNVAKNLIESGMDEKKARQAAEKIANEDARFILPNACATKIVVTMNARTLFNFFGHRCCNRAQWEIRAVAEEMYKLVYAIAPNIFANAGPNCVLTGKCPEGSMTCGKMNEMKERYQAIRNAV